MTGALSRGGRRRRPGLSLVSLLALVTTSILVSGCTSESSGTTPTAGASAGQSLGPTTESGVGTDTTAWIGEVIDPVDTTWVGTDSAGETTVFTLNDDRTVDVT